MANLDEYLIQIDHIGIATGDLAASLKFYQEVLGFLPVHQEENAEQKVVEVMLQPAGGGALIQLLAPTSPDSAIAKFLDKRGPGVQQLAYRVSDAVAASAAAREAGIRTIYDTPKRGTNDSKINFLHPADCGGVLVELVEPNPNH